MCSFRLSERSVPVYSRAQLAICPSTVAYAAPRTPKPNVKINIGSSTQLSTAPDTSPIIEKKALP